MMRVEPRLSLSVPYLLLPVRSHACPSMVPDQRRRCETDLQPLGLQSPADVDIVTRTDIDRIEAVDRQQRVPSKRHVTARYMLCDAVVEHDVDRPTRGACDALRHPRVVRGHDVRSADARQVGGEQRLNEVRQPVGVDAYVRIGIRDDLAGSGGEPGVPSRAQAAVLQVDDTDTGMPLCDVPGRITRPIVDDDDLNIGIGQCIERGQTFGHGVRRVVGAHHHRHSRPLGSGAGRERSAREDLLHGGKCRFALSRLIHEAKRPVVDRPTSTPPLVGPGIGHGTAGAFGKSRADVRCRDARLALETLPQAIPAGFREEQRSVPREVLQAREVAAQLGLPMEVDVIGEHVEGIELEVLGGWEVYISQQAVGRRCLHIFIEVTQELLDPSVAVPADDPGRNLVAQREKERRRVLGDAPDGRDGVVSDASSEPSVVEKRDVLWPREPDHHVETVSKGRVEQHRRRWRVGAHRIDTDGRHQRKVLLDALRRRELRSLAVRSERAVGHALDQDTTPADFQELPIDVRAAAHFHRSTGRLVRRGVLRDHVHQPVARAVCLGLDVT